jgi:hypothetical protein
MLVRVPWNSQCHFNPHFLLNLVDVAGELWFRP